MHKPFYTFLTPPPDNQPIAKWTNPLLCFLAVTNLQEDGTFETIATLTTELCRWEYNMHGTGLYKAVTDTTGFASVVEWVV